MNQDDIIRMAQEAGLLRTGDGWTEPHRWGATEIERFAKLVRDDYSYKHASLWLRRMDEAVRAEREACALVCGKWDDDVPFNSRECAEAIRSRGKV